MAFYSLQETWKILKTYFQIGERVFFFIHFPFWEQSISILNGSLLLFSRFPMKGYTVLKLGVSNVSNCFSIGVVSGFFFRKIFD